MGLLTMSATMLVLRLQKVSRTMTVMLTTFLTTMITLLVTMLTWTILITVRSTRLTGTHCSDRLTPRINNSQHESRQDLHPENKPNEFCKNIISSKCYVLYRVVLININFSKK